MLPLIAFTLTAILHQPGFTDRKVTVEFKNGECTVNAKKVSRDVCGQLASEARAPLSELPWINAGDPARYIVIYKDEKQTWQKQASVRSENERESIRKLAIDVLKAADSR